jgi:hypothetical protein
MTENIGPLQEPGGLADSDSEQSFQRLVLESRDVRDFLAELAVRAASRLSVRGNTIHSGVTVIRRRKPPGRSGQRCRGQGS